MTAQRRAVLALVCVVPLGAGGCAVDAKPRLNAPPQGAWDEHPEWVSTYAYHNDQGMLADMSIADIHFVSHSADLSGTGEARLSRYAELLATAGGKINYAPTIRDEVLIDARLESARNFLRKAIPGSSELDVVLGLHGGRGMTFEEAKSGKDVAKQAEKRDTAYRLREYAGAKEGT